MKKLWNGVLIGLICMISIQWSYVQAQRLYGLNANGSNYPNSSGNIFSMNTNGTDYKVEYYFGDYGFGFSRDGNVKNEYPIDDFGNIYLVSSGSGLDGADGYIAKIIPNNRVFKQLYGFKDNNTGRSPNGILTLVGDKLYGATQSGGNYSNGVAFSYDITLNKYDTLFSFYSSTSTNVKNSGYNIQSIVHHDKYIYYITQNGGGLSNSNGAVTRYDIHNDTSGVIYTFFGNDFLNNVRGKVAIVDDIMYLSFQSGASGGGIGELNLNTFEIDYRGFYTSNTTGNSPETGLYKSSNGKLYVYLSSGPSKYSNGEADRGVIVEYDRVKKSAKEFVPLSSTKVGSSVVSNIYEIKDGILAVNYESSGPDGGSGCIVTINLTTKAIDTARVFRSNDNGPYSPFGPLIMSNTGKRYLMFNNSGMDVVRNASYSGSTSLFELDSNFKTKIINVFGSNLIGVNTYRPIVKGSDNELWGITNNQGLYNSGTIFRTNSSTKQLFAKYSFYSTYDSLNFSDQDKALVSSGDNLYMVGNDGKYSSGGIAKFNIKTNTYRIAHFFNSANSSTEFYNPRGLKALTNGNLLGTTQSGGSTGNGGFFYLDTASAQVEYFYNFQNHNGDAIRGMVEYDGNIYFISNGGGLNYSGYLAKININTKTVTVLLDFESNTNSYGIYSRYGDNIVLNGSKLYFATSNSSLNGLGALVAYDITSQSVTNYYPFTSDKIQNNDPFFLTCNNNTIFIQQKNGGSNGSSSDGIVVKFDISTETFTTSYSFNELNKGRNPSCSLVTLNDVCLTTTSTINVTECNSYTSPSGKVEYKTAGTYTFFDTIQNACGGDSIMYINLKLNPYKIKNDTITVCDTYKWRDGESYTENTSGVKPPRHTVTNASGCDSVYYLYLTIKEATADTQTIVACDSYKWINNITYTESNNTATYKTTNAVGCDSIVHLDLTINRSNQRTDTIVYCGESYTWINGITYTQSIKGVSDTFTRANNCDSVVFLNLTLKKPSYRTDVITACDSYTWVDGNTYTSSNNTATYKTTNAAGCDSIAKLNLTIKRSSTGTDNITTCGSYKWINGVTYTTSTNVPTFKLKNTVGCDSIVTLNLTITPTLTGTDVRSDCAPFQWIDGKSYTASTNTPTYTLRSKNGCDSIVTLNLTITPTLTGTDVRSDCSPFQWIDGKSYTASTNTPTYTLRSKNGCDSIVTLNLTILAPKTGTDNRSECAPFQWIDGKSYTASTNIPTYTLRSKSGCDSIVTLNLTIIPSKTGTATISACESFTWIDGRTYTASNTSAKHTLKSSAGCDSIVTLNLTIKNASAFTDVRTECAPFVWIDGKTYIDANNSAKHIISNALGCDSVITLNFTPKLPSANVQNKIACDSYTWIDGITYTSSIAGVVYKTKNSAGCDSVITLNLTINTIDATIIKVTDNVLFSNQSDAAYQWINADNNTPISGATERSFVPTENGNYAVIITKGTCSNQSNTINVNNIILSVEETASKFKIYPNPSNSVLNIDLDNINDLVDLFVVDMSGRIVESLRQVRGKQTLEINQYQQGTYFIQVIASKKAFTQKFIKVD